MPYPQNQLSPTCQKGPQVAWSLCVRVQSLICRMIFTCLYTALSWLIYQNVSNTKQCISIDNTKHKLEVKRITDWVFSNACRVVVFIKKTYGASWGFVTWRGWVWLVSCQQCPINGVSHALLCESGTETVDCKWQFWYPSTNAAQSLLSTVLLIIHAFTDW